jgi:hypothetical protein
MSGNIAAVIKYCWRADLKNGTLDLRNAIWYLADEIDRLEGNSDKPEAFGERIKAAMKGVATAPAVSEFINNVLAAGKKSADGEEPAA